ncbi:MAG: hypothetical protein M3404_00020 [Actinomycetota bacterium]|nr:hypothetical protein [Actinomycetota bacterium]
MSLQTPPRPGETPPVEPLAPSRGRPWLAWAAVAVGLAVVLGLAFALLRPDAEGDEERTGAVAPAAPTEQDKQAVVDAVLGSLRVALDVNNPPDPARAGEVRAYTTGPAYDSVVKAINENRRKGVTLRPRPNSVAREKVDVVSIHGDQAIARSCGVDDGLVVEMATGRVLDDDVVTDLTTIFLVREDGRWKVENNRVEQKWAGVAGCAAS